VKEVSAAAVVACAAVALALGSAAVAVTAEPPAAGHASPAGPTPIASPTPSAPAVGRYGAAARAVTAHLQKTFYDPTRGFYVKAAPEASPSPGNRKADDVWRQAAAISVLTAAARHEPRTYRPLLDKTFRSLDAFWDAKVPIPAYEPQPTRGNGNDKYYDDNAWLVIALAEAYQLTGERAYLARATATAKFVASGWDEQAGGGIWWHQSHKDGSKNACANGPAAVGFLRLAKLGPAAEADAWATLARKAADWTRQKLQADDGLFDDRLIVATGEVKRGKLTYNCALMLRAYLGLYRQGGRAEDLEQAKRIGRAAEGLLDKKTGVYRDPLKFSQFMVEADLDLYRATGEAYLLERAKHNADAYYAAWAKEPPPDMMSNAGIARMLWLLADAETPAGRAFWERADAAAKRP
jgi:predicted alpha-1,6-mannanase (GH76 family)